jgi:hypothetical protein
MANLTPAELQELRQWATAHASVDMVQAKQVVRLLAEYDKIKAERDDLQAIFDILPKQS